MVGYMFILFLVVLVEVRVLDGLMGLVFILAFTFFSLVGFTLIVSGDSVWCFVVDLLAVYFAVTGIIYFMIVVVFLCLVTNFWFWIWVGSCFVV